MSWKAFVGWLCIYALILSVAWIASDAALAFIVFFLVVTQIIQIQQEAIFGTELDLDRFDESNDEPLR